MGRKKKAPDPLGLEKMRLSIQSPDDTRVAESAWEGVCRNKTAITSIYLYQGPLLGFLEPNN